MSLLGPSLIDATDTLRAAAVQLYDASGNIITSLASTPPSTTGTFTTQSVTTTDATALASNPSRKKFTIYNTTGNKVQVALGFVSSASAYTFILAGNAFYESSVGDFTGAIHVSTHTGTSTLNITELT